MEPSVKLYVPREESFPGPLKYIDVTRTTDTSLDITLKKNIDDYWNVDGDRESSDTWTGFTRFTLLSEKPLDGYTWSRKRLTRIQKYKKKPPGPTYYGQKCGKNVSDASKRKEKQKWAIEKPKLDNARKLRGIYFIDPHDEGNQGYNEKKTRTCIAEADESTRKRLEGSLHKYHEDHIAGKGMIS